MSSIVVNDVHSALNQTAVRDVLRPATIEGLRQQVCHLAGHGMPVALTGGRHAMGGQQFLSRGHIIDMTGLDRVHGLDFDRGIVDAEAGIAWPALIDALERLQAGIASPWSIRQKQTGADDFTLGGSLAANIHGRGLTLPPIVGDVESFDLLTAGGNIVTCSRQDHADLFRLAIGGYGLFGAITRVRLRLMRRQLLRRQVRIADVAELSNLIKARTDEGWLYGDMQYVTDPAGDDFMRRGILSCYEPAPDHPAPSTDQVELTLEDWKRLYRLAFTDKRRAFIEYAAHYLATDGQTYWSDLSQLSPYLPGHHDELARPGGGATRRSLMITELYVPPARLPEFMAAARHAALRGRFDVVYGTIRFIRRDSETFLPWAREHYACIIVNLAVTHTPEGIDLAQGQFRDLIDIAIAHGGSFYLTYHRWARRDQVLSCYPQMPAFIARKRAHDPNAGFRSDWFDWLTRLIEA